MHANQFLGGHGGDITVISTGSTVSMFGRALQANSSTNAQSSGGGTGGRLVILAHDAVAFGNGVAAYVQAAGDANGAGGTVLAQSFNGNVTGPLGSVINADGPGGLVTLRGCADPIGTYLGTVIATTYTHTAVCPGGSPPLPVPANTLLPLATCATRCGALPAGNKTGVKFLDANGNHKQDAGEPGLIGWSIDVFNRVSKTLVSSTFTVAANPLAIPPTPDGFYSFTLPVGDYTVCEGLQPGWTQTAPSGFFPVPPPETLADCTTYTNGGLITPGPAGYNFVIAGAEVHANNDFGNFQPGDCPEGPLPRRGSPAWSIRRGRLTGPRPST